MKQLVLLAALAAFSPLGMADSITVSDNNSTLKFTRDDPTANLRDPSDPVQLPRKVEWFVDGRRILVYPSSPANVVDVGHLHSGAHVRATNDLSVALARMGFKPPQASPEVPDFTGIAATGTTAGAMLLRNRGTSG